jgi:CubicO group peptidase (beta-lactamase class C family)
MPDRDALRALCGRLTGCVGGGVAAVRVRDRSLVEPFGLVSIAGRRLAPTADDAFSLTSITKPVTALQIVALADRGLIDLQAPIAEYLPAFAVNGKHAVTTAHVLTHTSGFDPSANAVEGAPSELTADDYLELAMRGALIAPPGDGFAYCSPPFWVLGALIAQAAEMCYVRHLDAQIAGPLGWRRTGYRPAPEPPERLVAPDAEPDRRHIAEQTRRVAYPAGGLVGTAPELLDLGSCLLAGGAAPSGRVVSRAGVELMRTPAAAGTIAGRAVRWGLGWELGGPGDLRGHDALYHSGVSGVALWIDPGRGLVAVLLTGRFGVPRRVFAEFINGVVGSVVELDGSDDH